MSTLLTAPPPPEAIMAMVAIPGMHIESTILATQQGPSGDLGPEAAGAILILQATFVDEAGAAGFWAAAVPLMQLLAEAPGFIRRFSFPDGPTITLIALWETVEAARAFGASPEHRAVAAELYRQRWQYTHFSAIWEMRSNHGRQFFCDRCDAVTAAPSATCSGCGAALDDVFRVES